MLALSFSDLHLLIPQVSCSCEGSFLLCLFFSLSPPASMSIKVAITEIEIHILISGSDNKRVFYSAHITPPQIITTSGMEKFQKQS